MFPNISLYLYHYYIYSVFVEQYFVLFLWEQVHYYFYDKMQLHAIKSVIFKNNFRSMQPKLHHMELHDFSILNKNCMYLQN